MPTGDVRDNIAPPMDGELGRLGLRVAIEYRRGARSGDCRVLLDVKKMS